MLILLSGCKKQDELAKLESILLAKLTLHPEITYRNRLEPLPSSQQDEYPDNHAIAHHFIASFLSSLTQEFKTLLNTQTSCQLRLPNAYLSSPLHADTAMHLSQRYHADAVMSIDISFSLNVPNIADQSHRLFSNPWERKVPAKNPDGIIMIWDILIINSEGKYLFNQRIFSEIETHISETTAMQLGNIASLKSPLIKKLTHNSIQKIIGFLPDKHPL